MERVTHTLRITLYLRKMITMKKMITTCRNQRRRIFWFIVLICFLYLTGNLISICTYSRKDETCRADVVIVLGAATYQEDVSPVYRERLNHGIDLYRQGYVEKIIVTGGLAEGNQHSDAYTAMQYVISRGIPVEDILMEEKSSITQENLENAKKLMDQNGYQRAVIVSDPLHMKRAMLLAEDAGIQAFSSPTPTTMYHSLKTKIPFLARELFYYIGYRWYRITN